MKNLWIPCLVILMLATACSAMEADNTPLNNTMEILSSNTGGDNYHVFGQFTKNADGTWTCGEYTYQYYVVLWGLDGIPAKTVGYLVLTNDLEITFEEIQKSMYSSSTYDWIPASRAKLVGFIY